MRITFTIPEDLPPGEIAWLVKHLIEGAARGWAAPFRRLGLPPLYDSGIRFAYEPNHGTGIEEFADPFLLLARKEGDCDDLCIYRLAEIQAAGRSASCRAVWDGTQLHVQVRHPDGSLEDPAKELGAP